MRDRFRSAPHRYLIGVTLLLAGAFLWLPIRAIFIEGVFRWHLQQPQTVGGALELLALLGIVMLVFFKLRESRMILVALAVLLELYLRRHHVDLPAIAVWIQLEALLAAGSLIESLPGVDVGGDETARDARHFIGGLSLWSLLALCCSALGFGSAGNLFLVMTLFAIFAIGLTKRKPLAVRLFEGVSDLGVLEKIVAAYLVAQVVCLFARTNVTHYHDSLWYGFRLDSTLAPTGSIFESAGLVHQVHYYPKLFELLLLPFSGFGEFSFVLGVNVAAWILLTRMIFSLGVQLGLRRSEALLVTSLAGSVPAIANVALTTKPDLFACLLLVVAASSFLQFLETGNRSQGIYGLAAVLLSMTTKVTSFPYGGLLVIGVGLQWIWTRYRLGNDVPKVAQAAPSVSSLVVGVMAVAVASLLTLRTYLLTGLPTIVPEALVHLWQRLGFDLRYPVGVMERSRGKALDRILETTWDFLFEPTDLLYIQITWTGNGWAYLVCVALVAAVLLRNTELERRTTFAFWPVIASGIFFALGFNNAQRGGDGNYYIFPLVLGTLLAFRATRRWDGDSRSILCLTLIPFIALQSLVGFVSAAWSPGTKPLGLDFTESVFDTKRTRHEILDGAGLGPIGAYLETFEEDQRIVGLGPLDLTRWLPGRYEALEVMSLARPNPIATTEQAIRFLVSQKIDFLLTPRLEPDPPFDRIIYEVESLGAIVALETPLYRLYDVSRLRAPESAKESRESTSYCVETDLLDHMGRAVEKGQRAVGTPWGNAIATADARTSEFTRQPTLILHEDTDVTWSLDLSSFEAPLWLRGQIGMVPQAELSGASDGVLVSIMVASSGGEATRTALPVAPGSGYQIFMVPLDLVEGGVATVEIVVSNEPDHDASQDWVMLIDPEVVRPRSDVAESGWWISEGRCGGRSEGHSDLLRSPRGKNLAR